MNYTEADVERARLALKTCLHAFGTKFKAELDGHLTILEAAALEGAKVPGLEQERDALLGKPIRDDEREWAGDPAIAWRAYHKARSEVSALQARVAELEDMEANLRRSCEVEIEIQKTLTAERDAIRATADRLVAREVEITSERDAALEQRDALCAQVTRLRQKAEALSRVLTPEPEDFPSEAALALGALESEVASLSAPPAETKAPEPTEAEEHARLDGLGVPRFDRCPATNRRERMSLAERKEWWAANPRRTDAETTPAPEHKKRSCNLHSDCEAADSRARADGRPKGVTHCNDSDCSDHQCPPCPGA